MSEWKRAAQPVRMVIELDAPLTVRRERGVLVQGDENANAIVAEVYQTKGVPYDLSGSTVILNFVRPDNLAVTPIAAEITGNVAVMTLTDACYRVSGLYAASVKLHKGDAERTIARVLGDIISTDNDGTVYDEELFPTPEELVKTLEQMEEARDNANEAAQNATTAAGAANAAAAKAEQAAIDAEVKAEPTLAAIAQAEAESVAAVQKAGEDTLATIPADYTAMISAVAGLRGEMDKAAPGIEVEQSGSIVSIADGAEKPAVSLVSHIEPVQEGEGDPSPENVRPIRGWDKVSVHRASKNLADDSTMASIASWNEDENAWVVNAPRDSNRPVFFAGNGKPGVYTLSYDVKHEGSEDGDASICVFRYTDGSTGRSASSVSEPGVWRRVSLTSDPNKTIKEVGYGYFFGYSSHPGYLKNIMLAAGEIDTPYEPYQGKTLTTDLPETVYGGTLDWGTGVLTVDSAVRVFDGTETDMTYNTRGTINGVESIASVITHSEATTRERLDVICSHLPTKYGANVSEPCIFNRTIDNGVAINYDTGVDISGYTQSEVTNAVKTWMAEQYAAGTPVTIVYKLAEPYTIQLTPEQMDMLKGANNVWSDSGDTDLVYIADTKMYIDNKFNELAQAMIGG